MGNRLENNECVRCGAPLVDLNPQWHMCTKCIKEVTQDFLRIKQRKKEDKRSKIKHKMWMPPEMIKGAKA